MKVFIITENGFAEALRRALSVLSFNRVAVIKDVSIEMGKFENFLESPDVTGSEIIILEAKFGEGLILLETLRQDLHLPAPVVVLSLEKREKLQREYPIIGEGVPGIYFVRMPFYLEELKSVLDKAVGLSQEQLDKVLNNIPPSKGFLRQALHDMVNLVRAGKIDKARALFQRLRKGLNFLPHSTEIEELDRKLRDNVNKEELSELVFRIQRGLFEGWHDEILSRRSEDFITRCSRLPVPQGFQYILVVDDHGYDPGSIDRLTRKGYCVDLITSYSEALNKIEYDPPDVLLCDWRLEGTCEHANKIASEALKRNVKVVILISADRIENPPAGVEICTGEDKFNAELIHGLICKKAGLLKER